MQADTVGGFIVSRHILEGIPVRYSFRKKTNIQQLNGWNLLSEEDDDEYVQNSENFCIVSAETIKRIVPELFVIYDAPFGTDLFWIYTEDGDVCGFYDLIKKKRVSVQEILCKEEKTEQ